MENLVEEHESQNTEVAQTPPPVEVLRNRVAKAEATVLALLRDLSKETGLQVTGIALVAQNNNGTTQARVKITTTL